MNLMKTIKIGALSAPLWMLIVGASAISGGALLGYLMLTAHQQVTVAEPFTAQFSNDGTTWTDTPSDLYLYRGATKTVYMRLTSDAPEDLGYGVQVDTGCDEGNILTNITSNSSWSVPAGGASMVSLEYFGNNTEYTFDCQWSVYRNDA